MILIGQYMRLCFEFSGKKDPGIRPKSVVGALIVLKTAGHLAGYHKKYGSAHREINAINSADGKSRGVQLSSLVR